MPSLSMDQKSLILMTIRSHTNLGLLGDGKNSTNMQKGQLWAGMTEQINNVSIILHFYINI
jgi:hypothetical protein